VAFAGEESVCVGRAQARNKEDTMTLYIIGGDTVTAYASTPARGSEDELRVRSAKEIEASRMSNGQMAAIWNALPGTTPIAKFKDRKTAVQRLWAAFNQLPVAAPPGGGSGGRHADSKQARGLR
jgi:hypothetical protein